MIERSVYVLEGPPPMVARERSVLDCGCMVFVGLRVDREPPEASTGAVPCSDDHRGLIDRFNLALTDGLVNPSDRPLIDVVDELLTETAR